jgi:hypothetical protein
MPRPGVLLAALCVASAARCASALGFGLSLAAASAACPQAAAACGSGGYELAYDNTGARTRSRARVHV